MQCILTDPEAVERRVNIAANLGMSLPPLISEHCVACNTIHIVETGEYADPRYGLPPVTLPKSGKPLKWFPRSYCHTCHAYHNDDNFCPGPREATEMDISSEAKSRFNG